MAEDEALREVHRDEVNHIEGDGTISLPWFVGVKESLSVLEDRLAEVREGEA